MTIDPEFSDLVRRLRKTDNNLIALLAQRMHLSQQIAYAIDKQGHDRAQDFKKERLQEGRNWAAQYGLNPDFVEALLNLVIIIDETRLAGLQTNPEIARDGEISELRANLLALTARVAASYDQSFDKHFFATKAYRRFESELIDSVVAGQNDRCLALDLGCATGAYACRFSFLFSRVVGYDISPSMIDYAKRSVRNKRKEVLSFVTADLDNRIAEEDSSASLIVMNLGTASEVRDAGALLMEIQRLLKVGGKAVLSFYNGDALVYKWEFIPWDLSLAAEMNPRRNCLDVHVDQDVFSIFAKAYSIDDIKSLLPPSLKLTQSVTYPTASSILPNELLDEELIRDSVENLDHQLSSRLRGNYLIIVCEKI